MTYVLCNVVHECFEMVSNSNLGGSFFVEHCSILKGCITGQNIHMVAMAHQQTLTISTTDTSAVSRSW